MLENEHSSLSAFKAEMQNLWLRNHFFILFPVWVTIIGSFILPVFSNFAVVTGVFLVLSLLVCIPLATDDVMQGTEEFALALPATRRERYVSRVVCSLTVPVSAWVTLELLRFNVAPRLWGVIVDSGFSDYYPSAAFGVSGYLGVALPAFFGALCLSWGMQMKRPGQILMVLLLSLLLLGGLAWLCFSVEHYYFGQREGTGDVLLWLSSILTPLLVVAALPLYIRKEVSPADRRGGSIAAVVFAVVAILAVLFLMYATV